MVRYSDIFLEEMAGGTGTRKPDVDTRIYRAYYSYLEIIDYTIDIS